MIRVVERIEDANCITHSGTMHADEVFSTVFLDLYKGESRVFRTNKIEQSKVRDDAIIYDIGRGKFDHHQLDAKKRENNIPYCSFGLLWEEYGKDFLKNYGIDLVEEVWQGIDKDLVEAIDGDDNGIFPKIESPYKVKTIPNVIKLFNPSFDSGEIEKEQFEKACDVAKKIFEEEILYINGKVIAEKEISNLLEEKDENTKYLILDKFLPYEEALLNSEKAKDILFVAYPSNRGGYAIKVVPKSLDDHTARQSFPKEWAGLENEDLENISEIKGLTFCHSACFIVSCDSLEAVYSVFDKIC